MTLFGHWLRVEARLIAFWTAAIAVMACFIIQFYGLLSAGGALDALAAMMKNLPPAMKAWVGAVDLLTSVDAFVAAMAFGSLPAMLLVVFLASLVSGTMSRESEEGTVETVMAWPVSRVSFYLAKAGVVAVGVTAGHLGLLAGVLAGARLAGQRPDAAGYALAAVGSLLAHLALAGLLLAVASRVDDQSQAFGLTAGVGLFLFILARIDVPRALERLLETVNPFSRFVADRVIREAALVPGDAVFLVMAAAALLGLGLFDFARRSIPR
jgi:ABC-2 type transport system permease protein